MACIDQWRRIVSFLPDSNPPEGVGLMGYEQCPSNRPRTHGSAVEDGAVPYIALFLVRALPTLTKHTIPPRPKNWFRTCLVGRDTC